MSDESGRHFWQVPERLVTGAWAEKNAVGRPRDAREP